MSTIKKIILFAGTRPEAIKMIPLAVELKKNKKFKIILVSTGQHKELLDDAFKVFKIKADIKLNLFNTSMNNDNLLSKIYKSVSNILKDNKPDFVLVHGDTANSMICALAAFNEKLIIGHVEAGLRSHDNKSPWPEEVYRKMITNMSSYHFCPTKINMKNLIKENIKKQNILVCGNTVIDAVKLILQKTNKDKYFNRKFIKYKKSIEFDNKNKNVITTIHRREKYGQNINLFCKEIKKISKLDVKIFITLHHNPNIKKPIIKNLSNIKNIKLIDPVDYDIFINLLNESFFVISDSGGIQEELTILKKPLLVIRNKTERIEAVNKTKSIMVGDDCSKLFEISNKLVSSKSFYSKFNKIESIYGKGITSMQISKFIKKIKQ